MPARCSRRFAAGSTSDRREPEDVVPEAVVGPLIGERLQSVARNAERWDRRSRLRASWHDVDLYYYSGVSAIAVERVQPVTRDGGSQVDVSTFVKQPGGRLLLEVNESAPAPRRYATRLEQIRPLEL